MPRRLRIRCTSPKTPTCEVPSNGVVEKTCRTAHALGNVPISRFNLIMNIFISNGWLNNAMTSLQFSIYKSLLEQSTDSILGSSQE